MTTDDFTTAARAEAGERWPSYPAVGFSGANDRQHAFREGATWARDHLAADIREAQAEALREAAMFWSENPDEVDDETPGDIRNWMRDRADQIEKEETR